MRTLPALLTAAAVAAAGILATTAPATAASDWRQDACTRVGPDAGTRVSGSGTVVSSTTTRVEQLAGVNVVADRLDFSGVTCELLYVTGALPEGTRVNETSFAREMWFDLVVGDVQQDPVRDSMGGNGSGGWFSSRLPGVAPRHTELIAVETFRAVETGVVPDESGVPTEWKGDTYTVTHVRTDWQVGIAGSRQVRKTFEVTAATKTAAEHRLARQLRAARTAEQRQTARKTYRLALRGIKLVRRKLDVELTGSQPR